MEKPIPKRRLGKTGLEVTILGLGGEGLLRSYGQEKAAMEMISEAIDLGINYLESARAYAGSEIYYGEALKGKRDKIYLASKSHARDRKGALAHLDETLKNMKTDYLDVWQIHDVRTEDDFNVIFGANGALEAFVEAKAAGKVRFIGVTGHQDPLILKRCLEAFDFDTVLIPVNPAEQHYKPFIEEIVPIAGAKDIGVVAMKTYLRGLWDAPKKLLFNYALTQPVATAVIGADNIEQLRENAELASNFFSLKHKEIQRIAQIVSPFARELLYYKP
ncbi:MAG: aldo/keto reductase [Deltaproteobacteria bacterium GWB2_55_19]|nr:MAG: aldo/keto reductase [Deltaproteobacteria bacterium GWB2_55_19]HAO92639.1 aldo/keto reductase [Deltaproteobacteria bacterium]